MSNKERGLSYARNNPIPYSNVHQRVRLPTSYGACMTIVTIIEWIIVFALPVLPIIAFMEVADEVGA